jgi:diguanylate cyclase (GGDEF)-like protein/PAS domain S-box-containing protein
VQELPTVTRPVSLLSGSSFRQRLADIVRLVSDIVLETDRDLTLTYVSARSIEVLGFQPWEMVGRPLSAFGRFLQANGEAGGPDWHHPFRDRPFLAIARDGKPRHLLISALPVFDSASEAFAGVRATAEDLTGRKANEERLRKLSMAVEQSPASVIITDRNGIIEYVNRSFVETSGYSPEEAVGCKPSIINSGRMPQSVYREMWRALIAGEEWRGELYNRKKSGEGIWEYTVISPIFDEHGAITHFVGTKEDVTARKRFEEELLRQGTADEITGLPNRVLALDRLEQALARARRSGGVGALLQVDLDHFKRVNDILGHHGADQVLLAVGRRLVSMVRPEDTVARLGDDEFGILAEDCSPADIEGLAQRVLRGFAKSFAPNGQEIFVTPSIGVTIFPDDADTAGQLMRNADTAVRRAKEMGRNSVQFFTPDLNQQAFERARLEAALHHALDRGELSLHYQPMMEMTTRRLVGAEALMRWHSAEFGQIPPDRFIPLSESSGLILRLGSWALETVCAQAAEWLALFGPQFRLAVNVSPRQVRQPGFAEHVLATIEKAGIHPGNLEVEITEGLLMDERVPAGDLLRLRQAGIRLSIDDFGTGYSSLGYLKRFPLDTLKIDRSFVRDLADGGADLALVETIIAMAHCLGLEVVAEGVETLEQFEMLFSRKCNFCQGFLIGRPVPAAEFLDSLPHDMASP